MRILFVLAYYHPYIGGAEYLFKRLAEGLCHSGHSVKVITSHLAGTPDHEVINGVEIERVRVPYFYDRCFFSLLNLPNIIYQIRDYELVHTASNNISMPVSLIGRAFGKPVVFTCHEYLGKRWHLVEPNPLKALLFRTVEKMVVTHPYDRYVAVSQSTLSDLNREGIDPNLMSVVYNGVDEIFSVNTPGDGKLRAMLGLDRDHFVYLYYGRPGVTKGVSKNKQDTHCLPMSFFCFPMSFLVPGLLR